MNRIEYKEGIIWCGEEKGKQSIIYIGCLPIRTNWKNRKRNVRFNKSMYAIL